jgi:lysophospholipase L1-like esterase
MLARSLIAAAAAAALLTAANAHAQTPGLQPGDKVAICGDSITEQHIYSADIEAYLILCKPAAGLTAEQFGWGGETAPGFHQKMPRFMLPFGNTVATTCYGMNDGHYAAMKPETADVYRRSTTAVVEAMKKAGYRFIVVGTPGAVDTTTYHKSPQQAAVYNQTLAALGDIDREIAKEQGVGFADVHAVMADVMAKAKAKYGDGYVFAGPDGVHPGPNGHLVMAYAFLKALGVSGDVGTVTFDGRAQTATATDGHKVLGCANGTIDLESTRYPFCFSGDPAKPDATSGVIEFFPFNDDLNRFKLVATNVGSDKVRVTFGKASKEFAAADLAKGINLAAEFLDNPFSGPFAAEMKKIQAKQVLETKLDKDLLTSSMPTFAQAIPEAKPAYAAFEPAIPAMLAAQAKAVADAVPPVRYQIKVEPVR